MNEIEFIQHPELIEIVKGYEQLNKEKCPPDIFSIQTLIINKIGRIFGDENFGKIPKPKESKPEKNRVFKKIKYV